MNATVSQRRVTTVAVAAQFFWATQWDFTSLGITQSRAEKRKLKKDKKQLELKLKNRWRQVASA